MFGNLQKTYLAIFFVSFILLTLKQVNANDRPIFGFGNTLKNFKRSQLKNFMRSGLGNDKRSSSTTCTYKGKTHEQGSEWLDVEDCEECHCQTGDIVRCVPVKCDVPMCVDFYRPEGKCCDACPGYPNCWLDGNIISAGPTVIIPMGNCKKLCRCPGPSTYATDGENTQANCEMHCEQH